MYNPLKQIDCDIKKHLCFETDISKGWLELMELNIISKKIKGDLSYSIFKLHSGIKQHIEGWNEYMKNKLVFSAKETEDEIVKHLKTVPFIESVSVENGYINLTLENEYFWKKVFSK